jgi:hypothetical protein
VAPPPRYGLRPRTFNNRSPRTSKFDDNGTLAAAYQSAVQTALIMAESHKS